MKKPRPPWLLVLAVLALHLLLGREVQRIQDGWVTDVTQPMPPRMQVEFTREMPLQAPPVAVRVLPPPPKSRPRPRVAAAMPQGASAPDVPIHAASEPAAQMQQLADVADMAPVMESASEAAPSAAPAASAVNGDEPGAEWPLSTRLTYVLTGNYRGPVSGQAQVEWLRKGRDYQVHLDVGIGPSFAPLITRRLSSQGQLTPQGIAPRRYDEETKIVFMEPRRANLVFLDAGVQDAASQFVQLTWLFLTGREPLQPGHVVRFPLLLPGGRYDWQYEVTGEEALDTPLGALQAWHLKPRQAAMRGDLTAEVWLAPSLQYLPVRLVIRQDADTYIDLMLKSAPLQAAPESGNDVPRRVSP